MILICGFKHVSNAFVLLQHVMPMAMEILGPTPWYITLCQYLCKCLLALGPNIQRMALCVVATNNNNYFGCDYKMCFFSCAKGSTFWSVIVGGLRWSNIEIPCAQLCVMSSSQRGWPNWLILSDDSYANLSCMLCGQSLGTTTMLICD